MRFERSPETEKALRRWNASANEIYRRGDEVADALLEAGRKIGVSLSEAARNLSGFAKAISAQGTSSSS